MKNETLDRIDGNIYSKYIKEFTSNPSKYIFPKIKFLVKKDDNYYVTCMLNSYVDDNLIDILVYDLKTNESIIMKIDDFINDFSLNDMTSFSLENINSNPNRRSLNDLNGLFSCFADIISDINNIDIHKYNNEYYPNILKFLNDNEKKYYYLFSLDDNLSALNESEEEMNQMLLTANQLIYGENKDFEKAKNILFDYVKGDSYYDNDNTTEYYNFDDAIDFILYIRSKVHGKDVNWITKSFTTAYYNLSFIFYEEKNYDEALKMLDKAIRWAPMSMRPLFEKCANYQKKNDLEKFKEITDSVYDKIYRANDLARYYRNLGYYYIEKGKYNLAYALYLTSLKYEKSNSAYGEMAYINQLLNREKYDMPDDEVVKLLTENNMPLGPKKENVDKLIEIYSTEKELLKNPNIEKDLTDRIYLLTKDKNFAPLIELIDHTTGCSIVVPRNWKPMNDNDRKVQFGTHNMFAVFTDDGSLFLANYVEKCSVDNFYNTYKQNIDSVVNNNVMNMKLVNEGSLSLNLLQGVKEFKYALMDIVLKDKVIRLIYYYTLINGIFVEFSINLDVSIDYNDKEKFNNQKNMVNMINILSNIIEMKIQDNSVDNNENGDSFFESEINIINTNFKNDKNIESVFKFADSVLTGSDDDPFWVDLSKKILIYIMINLLESNNEIQFNDIKNIFTDKDRYYEICKNSNTSLTNDKLTVVIKNIEGLSDKMLDSCYEIITKSFKIGNDSDEFITHNLKFNDNNNYNIVFPKKLGQLNRIDSFTFLIGDNITIMKAICNNSELLESRANEWLEHSANNNNQTILNDLDNKYVLPNQMNVFEKTVEKDNIKRYYKFICFNQSMLIFAYNDKELSKDIDEAIISLKAIKDQIKVERNPFESPSNKKDNDN